MYLKRPTKKDLNVLVFLMNESFIRSQPLIKIMYEISIRNFRFFMKFTKFYEGVIIF